VSGTRLTLRVDFGPGRSIGPGKIRLLEAVERTGSISQAGRALGMSYRRAWLLIDDMNHGEIGALLLYGVNPAYDYPDADGFLRGLAKVPLSISFADRRDDYLIRRKFERYRPREPQDRHFIGEDRAASRNVIRRYGRLRLSETVGVDDRSI